jgi:NADH-quinone oxidoreductase subunit N
MIGWLRLLPEIVLALTIGGVLAGDLFFNAARRKWLSPLALAGAAAALILIWVAPDGEFGRAWTGDALGRYLKTIIILLLGLTILSAWDFDEIWKRPRGEFLILLLASALGMLFLASGNELVLLYVGLELTTFPLVLLTAYRPADAKSAEGGLKYLVMAAMGSAILLFGLSLIYAATGVTRIPELAAAVVQADAGVLILLGVVCVLAGIGFKLALVPFHMWAPDAYEGAPTPVTAFLSVAGKIAGFALALRLLVSGLSAAQAEWGQVLAALAVASMFLGNLAAIPQTNLKRLLAYSAIAQAGYMVMGLVAFKIIGISALLFYLGTYLFTNLGAFAVVIAVERVTGSTDMPAYAGLAQRSPRLGLAMLLALLSLAGIPPLAGFAAKFYLFTAVFSQGYVWLVIIAVINTAISLYYYLRVIRVVYILPPDKNAPAGMPLSLPLAMVLLITVLGILVLGIYPGPFVEIARAAIAPWF